MSRQIWIIPIIIFSQFTGTSLWFAGNAVIADIQQALGLGDEALSHTTSAVQFGFIVGTLAFALLTIADRFSPSKVFLFCSVAGALANFGIYSFADDYFSLISLRVLTGFFLAGIYPVGMKIAADHRDKGLGLVLGFLVGALVLGTAFPHLIRRFTVGLPWEYVIVVTSVFAAFGGVLMYLWVPDGAYRKKSTGLDLAAFFRVYRSASVRNAAFGYFGHMWELYTFWAMIPVLLRTYQRIHPVDFDSTLSAFIIIAMGGPACVFGGYLSRRWGSAKVAFGALALSALCCLCSPLLFQLPFGGFICYLLCWGMTVVADSPQFSVLVAQNAERELVGTALTMTNCIGFAITIVSIQLFYQLELIIPETIIYLILAPGPLFGLIYIFRELQPVMVET